MNLLIILAILFLMLICVSLIYLLYVLMNIDAIYNIKTGDIQHVVNELNKYSVRVMFFLTTFIIILLMIITLAFLIAMVSNSQKFSSQSLMLMKIRYDMYAISIILMTAVYM